MKKIKVRQLGIAAILLLCAVFCQGQERKKDTVMVLMVVSDTTKIYDFYTADGKLFGHKMTDEKDLPKGGKKVLTGFLYPQPFNMYGYSVREIYNEAEGTIDWYFEHQRPPEDYPVHKFYLDNKKRPLKNIVVWQSVSAK